MLQSVVAGNVFYIHVEQWWIVEIENSHPTLLQVRTAADTFRMNSYVRDHNVLSVGLNFHDCTFLVFVAVISEDSTFHL